MSKLTWLHLSDLHFRADVQHQWDENVVLQALLIDVRQQVEKCELQPQFVVVSGDLAFSGKADEYKLAGDFLDALLMATGLKKECLFIVPGNHDVNLANRAWGSDVIAAALTGRDAVRGALAGEASRQLLLASLRDYAAFAKGYLGTSSGVQDQPLCSVHDISADSGRKVSVLCLNSSWLANGGEADRAKLALGEDQVRAAVLAIAGADLRIALMHHPFEWLADFDRKVCEPLLVEGCDFILRGHLHRTDLLSLKTPDSEAMIIAAGAAYETREHANAFNWVQLDLDSGEGQVHLRAYSDKGVAFWTRDVTTYKNVTDGAYPFTACRLAGSRQTIVPAVAVLPARLSEKEQRHHEANYLRYVQRTSNAVPLHIIDPRAAQTLQPNVELAQTFVGLNTTTPQADPPKKGERGWADSVRAVGVRDGKAVSALEAADKESALVLLGGPGSGKSAFINHLALCLVGARLEAMGEPGASVSTAWLARLMPVWTRGALLPVLVTLRHFAKSDWCAKPGLNLWSFVVETMTEQGTGEFAHELHRLLDVGGVLVLLDGLDEVAVPATRQLVLDSIDRFRNAHAHPGNRWVVTCRDYAYQDTRCRLDNFATYELAAFDREQVLAFIDLWYREVRRLGWKTQAEADSLKQQLREAVTQKDIAPLAANPLQLTMVAALQFSWGKLPEDRVDLYQWMVSLLLVRWQEGKLGHEAGITTIISEPKLVSALETLAFVAHEDQAVAGGGADIAEAKLLSVLKDACGGDWGRSGLVVEFIRDRAGLLVDRGRSVYAFPHRSYQEYLAGSYLAVQPDFPDRAAELARENYAHWREVVLWAAAVMAHRNKMVHVVVAVANALCPAEPPEGSVVDADWLSALLAGEALLETGADAVRDHPVYGPTFNRVRKALQDLVERGALQPSERVAAGRALARMGDMRPGVGVRFCKLADGAEVTVPDLVWCEIPAGPFIMGSDIGEGPGLDPLALEVERPRHEERCIVHPYLISRYPITNGQFRVFEKDPGGYVADVWWTKSGKDWRGARRSSKSVRALYDLADYPRMTLTWYEAVAFCRWLDNRLHDVGNSFQVWRDGVLLNLPLSDGAWQCRLPTEAEWEKAARGDDGRRWSWPGDWVEGKYNVLEVPSGALAAVGLFPLCDSPYGCADMTGSWPQWCQTKWLPTYDRYSERETYRESLEGKTHRVARGLPFFGSAKEVRCAYRLGVQPDFHNGCFGFRAVIESLNRAPSSSAFSRARGENSCVAESRSQNRLSTAGQPLC